MPSKKVEFSIYREDDSEIECSASVTVVKPWRGSAESCPSSDDYYGYSEVDNIRATVDGAEVNMTQDEYEVAHEAAIEVAKEGW